MARRPPHPPAAEPHQRVRLECTRAGGPGGPVRPNGVRDSCFESPPGMHCGPNYNTIPHYTTHPLTTPKTTITNPIPTNPSQQPPQNPPIKNQHTDKHSNHNPQQNIPNIIQTQNSPPKNQLPNHPHKQTLPKTNNPTKHILQRHREDPPRLRIVDQSGAERNKRTAQADYGYDIFFPVAVRAGVIPAREIRYRQEMEGRMLDKDGTATVRLSRARGVVPTGTKSFNRL